MFKKYLFVFTLLAILYHPVSFADEASDFLKDFLLKKVEKELTKDKEENKQNIVLDNIVTDLDPSLDISSLSNWVLCAQENEICMFSGTRVVKYGAEGSFNYKQVTNGVNCTNDVFSDPIYGVVKSCYTTAGVSGNTHEVEVYTPKAPTSSPAIKELEASIEIMLIDIQTNKKTVMSKTNNTSTQEEKALANDLIQLLNATEAEVRALKKDIAVNGNSMSAEEIAVIKSQINAFRDSLNGMSSLLSEL